MAALGVTASLFFVGLEVRENTVAVRGATLQAVSQQPLDLTMAGLGNLELRAAVAAAATAEPGGLATEYRSILGWYVSARLQADENRFRRV